MTDIHPDSAPSSAPHPDSAPDTFPPGADDPRPDVEQEVEARSDAVARREGGGEVPTGMGGEGGADGVVKNQDLTAQ